MENVFEIKRKKNLNYILSKEKLYDMFIGINYSVIVVIHIYYYDRAMFYVKYMENIPEDIFLFITVTEEATKSLIQNHLKRNVKTYQIVLKENRGRDISTLLVVARKIILKYKYICFLHDKKEKNPIMKDDIEQWNYCLWENTVGSENYIRNIINIFETNKNIGLLVPPIPITENIEYGYTLPWGKDFKLTQEIAKQMNLKCNLNDNFPPIALGTVFWARTDALKKLFKLDWTYEDFSPEPLADDGTLSHAIERILPYIVQDAGFETGWVMTNDYAAEQMEYQIEILSKIFEFLNHTYKVTHISKARKLFRIMKELSEFCDNFQKIYIYGAGEIGKQCLHLMSTLGVKPNAFLVTCMEGNVTRLEDIPVQSVKAAKLEQNCGIIIAVRNSLVNEIQGKLFSRNIKKENLLIFKS